MLRILICVYGNHIKPAYTECPVLLVQGDPRNPQSQIETKVQIKETP